VRRLSDLEVRRRALLARCEQQRAELSSRFGQLGPRRWAQELAGSAAAGAVGALRSQKQHPLAWVVGIAALLLLRRPREVLWLLVRARGALAVLSRAGQVMSLLSRLRGKR
jgi:hypothetical protein